MWLSKYVNVMSFKFCTLLFILFFTTISFGQFEYGVKGGININYSGKITNAHSDLTSLENITENMKGYFIGSYLSIDLFFLYLRPEVQFTYLNKNFRSLSLSQSRIEAPISVGYKFLPILSCFMGPTFQYNYEPKIENISLSEMEKNASVGIHIGVRIHLGPINADARFDRGISPNELNFLEQNGVPISGKIDNRSELWSLGISYRF